MAVGDVMIPLPDCCGVVSCHGLGPDCIGKVWEVDSETKQMPNYWYEHIRLYHGVGMRCRPCADIPYLDDDVRHNLMDPDNYEPGAGRVLPIYGKLGAQQFDQHSPHCPGGDECIGKASGMTQSVAGRFRQHGILAQEPDGDLDSWTEEGIAEDERFYRRINDTAPGCQIHPHVITAHGIQEFDWRYWPLPAGQFCDSDAFLDERIDADGSTYNVIYQAVLHEWRQRTRDMHMRGEFKVRPGLPDRTYKKQRADSQLLMEERELPSLRSDDSGACGSPEADRLGDFE